MSTNTPNFGIVLPEGTDTFNPLTFNNTAFTRVDEVMKNNQDRGVTPATHIYLDGVNTISRNIATCNLMVFTATSDYEKGSIIAVDGVTCTFRYADGTAPESNAFRTNQSVICYLNGTILTMVSAGSGEAIIGKLSELTTTNKDTIVSAVNELNTDLSELEEGVDVPFQVASGVNVVSIDVKKQGKRISCFMTVYFAPTKDTTKVLFTIPNYKPNTNIYGVMYATSDQYATVLQVSTNGEVSCIPRTTNTNARYFVGQIDFFAN